MSVTVKKPTMVTHPLDNEPKETTSLLSRNSKLPTLTYGAIVFLMINRSINLVLYKAFTTFSWYFSEYFSMNYTLFAIIAVMNFPGNILNIICVPYYHQFRVRYVIMTFELLLAASCLLLLPWHNIAGLLVARLMTGFAITAARSEVNATIGAYTFGEKRTKAISIVEYSFGFSAIGFLVVGIVLEQFGWRVFFIGSAVIIVGIAVLVTFIIPPWYIQVEDNDDTQNTTVNNAGSIQSSSETETVKKKKKKKTKYSYNHLREVISHKRLQLVFLSVLLNKISRNAFYYTFSKWLALSYGLGPQQAGYISLFVAAGCLIGSSIVPVIVNKFKFGIFLTCLLGASLQILSMIVEPIYVLFGTHIGLYGACIVIFFFFCGCQVWYNNCLDIMIGVTPTPKLLPAVNTVLLAYGAFGGMIGTIGSTVWYEWGGEAAIALICAASNVGVLCLVILLWIANKKHKYITNELKDAMGIDDDNHKKNEKHTIGFIENREIIDKEIKAEMAFKQKNKNQNKNKKIRKIYPKPKSPNIVSGGASMVTLKIFDNVNNYNDNDDNINSNK